MDIKYVTSNSDLEKLVLRLKNVNKIAIDLEFDSNHHHYGFSLCLMQLYCGSTAYLVDPKKVDVSYIFPFLEDDKIQKVVFSFGEDLRLLHSLGCKPRNIYDISLGIKLLNYEKVSLADALQINMNQTLEKGSQKSDWCKRPFSEKQKIYAAHDVVYLFELQKHIENQSLEKDIKEWIKEENEYLETINSNEKFTNIIKQKNRLNLTEFEWFFYQKLWQLREEVARDLDKPAHQVINNNFMKEIVQDTSLINNWKYNKFIHRAIKKDSFQRKLQQLLAEAKTEAKRQNISNTTLEIKPLSKEKSIKIRARKKEIDRLKEKVFKPIQNYIRRDYGEFAVTHILSNKQIENIIDGKPVLNYKKQLIRKYAEEGGILLNENNF